MTKKEAKNKGWKKVPDAVMLDWDKQKSKPIQGKLISITDAKSKQKGEDGEQKIYKIFKVENESGQIAFTGSQLEQKLMNVKVGTEVKIVFTGKVKTKGGFKVNCFDVFIR